MLALRPQLSWCRRRGGALGLLQVLGGGAGGVDDDALHARVEGGVALDDGRVLGIGGQGLGHCRPRLAQDEDGVAGADGREASELRIHGHNPVHFVRPGYVPHFSRRMSVSDTLWFEF